MTLANKYLRYSPEITLDIFELVWNKLIESGFKSKYDNELYSEFKAFKSKYNCLVIDDTYFNTVMSLCIQNESETTAQEILGYDPFVNKEVIPEYVELLKGFDNTCTGKIFDTNQPIPQMSGWSNQWTWESIFKNNIQRPYFKPSTKEAFDAQSKSIEKWSVGSYVVAINDGYARGKPIDKYKIGFIDVITHNFYDETIGLKFSSNCCNNSDFKWFAAKSEAEEFAKTLVEPVKHGNGILDAVDVKQPLKKAVHCKTQEEWDFVTEKLGYKWSEYSKWSSYKNNTCINLNEVGFGTAGVAYKEYQILSFQEWCDLNGYKMEKEIKFEVGKWYKNLGIYNQKNIFGKFKRLSGKNNNEFWISECIYAGKLVDIKKQWLDYSSETIEASLEEIQQYLPDNHPDKIKVDSEFKVGEYIFVMTKGRYYGDILKVTSVKPDEKDSGIKGTVWIKHENSSFSGGGFRLGSKYRYNEHVRHATPEEINQHLISIGQIPAGEPLNTGIEPNKDGMFKYKQTMPGASWSGGTIDNYLDVMIQSKTQSEIEFNYLPEPK